MEKFSFYELFSFIVPGIAAMYLANLFADKIWACELIGNVDWSSSFLYIILAFFIGVLLHIFSQRKWFLHKKILCRIKVIKNLLDKDLFLIVVANKDLDKWIIPYLKTKCAEKTGMLRENITLGNLFTIAYNFLEVEEKGSVSKYHSFYNLFRYLVTLCVFYFVATLFVILLHYISVWFICGWNFEGNMCVAVWFLAGSCIAFVLLLFAAQWMRNMMIHKLFYNYYAYLIHQTDK